MKRNYQRQVTMFDEFEIEWLPEDTLLISGARKNTDTPIGRGWG